MTRDFAHLIETLELAVDGLHELAEAQAQRRSWPREKWIERRRIQEMVEQAHDEACSLALVHSGSTHEEAS